MRESNRLTTLKTLSLRIRGAKTELESAGLDAEDMATSTSKLRKELEALTGVDMLGIVVVLEYDKIDVNRFFSIHKRLFGRQDIHRNPDKTLVCHPMM